MLEGIIDDLFAVGLALHAGARGLGHQYAFETDPVLEAVDRIVARIRQSVLTSAGFRAQAGVIFEAIATGQLQQPDITALSSLPNRELSTIELLDAAHSATRALIALEHAAGPETRPSSVSTSTKAFPDRRKCPTVHPGPMSLADVAAFGAR